VATVPFILDCKDDTFCHICEKASEYAYVLGMPSDICRNILWGVDSQRILADLFVLEASGAVSSRITVAVREFFVERAMAHQQMLRIAEELVTGEQA